MLLGALLDAGCPIGEVLGMVRACAPEADISTAEVRRGGLRGLQASVAVRPGAVPTHRTLDGCLRAVETAGGLPPRVRDRAAAVLRRLGEAEARVHGAAPGGTHLHELDAVDTIADVVGVCAALELLDVDTVWCTPLPVAPGSVDTAHGRLPLPAPATLVMLAGAGVPLRPADEGVEHVTPTAAALLTTLARFEIPEMRLRAVGHGAGARDPADRPNLVRCWLGEHAGTEAAAGFTDPCVELRTNLDDASPAVVADLAARCLDAGALDVWVVAATMKKGRPGHILHVLVREDADSGMAAMLLEASPTLGVRRAAAPRMVAQREVLRFASPLGEVRVKRKVLRGRVVDVRPEMDDCREVASRTSRPLHEVIDTITAAARAAMVDGRDSPHGVQPGA